MTGENLLALKTVSVCRDNCWACPARLYVHNVREKSKICRTVDEGFFIKNLVRLLCAMKISHPFFIFIFLKIIFCVDLLDVFYCCITTWAYLNLYCGGKKQLR